MRLGFLPLANYSMIAFASALEPLRMANRVAGKALYEWQIVDPTGRAAQASNGLTVMPTLDPSAAPKFDIVFVCGGVDVHAACTPPVLNYLRRSARHQTALGAICTGAYALAKAGLVDGYRCAIHWENMAAVREEFPRVAFLPELFVIDRDRYTASGGIAPLDLMLHLIERDHGTEIAAAVSDVFIVERIRDARDRQRIPLQNLVGARQGKIIDAASLMEAHIEEPLSLEDLSHRVGLSRRQLERLFAKHLDCHPARYYLSLRLDRARQLLLQTGLSITDVTIACGFQSPPHFSKCYKAHFGHPPSKERRSIPVQTLELGNDALRRAT